MPYPFGMRDFDFDDAIAMAAEDQSRQRAAAASKDHALELRKVVLQAVAAAELEYRKQHPEAAGIGLNTEVIAYKKRSRVFRDFPSQLVDGFLANPPQLKLSNQQLAKSLEDAHRLKVPASFLTEKLTRWQTAKIAEILDARGIPLDLSKNDTVSKIKKALSALSAGELASFKFLGPLKSLKMPSL